MWPRRAIRTSSAPLSVGPSSRNQAASRSPFRKTMTTCTRRFRRRLWRMGPWAPGTTSRCTMTSRSLGTAAEIELVSSTVWTTSTSRTLWRSARELGRRAGFVRTRFSQHSSSALGPDAAGSRVGIARRDDGFERFAGRRSGLAGRCGGCVRLGRREAPVVPDCLSSLLPLLVSGHNGRHKRTGAKR
jgi:hypothetical protein